MTREEAKEILENWSLCHYTPSREAAEAVILALDPLEIIFALRPVSREQVEKVFPGCEKCRNQVNWPSWIEKGFVYCPKCGTPLTSWAWEKQVERLEALKDGSTAD